jgi:hypothetical protein
MPLAAMRREVEQCNDSLESAPYQATCGYSLFNASLMSVPFYHVRHRSAGAPGERRRSAHARASSSLKHRIIVAHPRHRPYKTGRTNVISTEYPLWARFVCPLLSFLEERCRKLRNPLAPPLHSNRQTSFLQALRFHSYRNAALHGGTRLTAAIRWGAFIEAMHGRHKRGPCCTLRL